MEKRKGDNSTIFPNGHSISQIIKKKICVEARISYFSYRYEIKIKKNKKRKRVTPVIPSFSKYRAFIQKLLKYLC